MFKTITLKLLQVEKEIGQVWRQMGIMYKQVSNSITILEKVTLKVSHRAISNEQFIFIVR